MLGTPRADPQSMTTVAVLPKPRRRSVTAPRAESMGVVDQVRLALSPKQRLTAFLGGLLGGFVPVCTFVLAHYRRVR